MAKGKQPREDTTDLAEELKTLGHEIDQGSLDAALRHGKVSGDEEAPARALRHGGSDRTWVQRKNRAEARHGGPSNTHRFR